MRKVVRTLDFAGGLVLNTVSQKNEVIPRVVCIKKELRKKEEELSILPSNKVKKVVQGDNTSEGSIVEVYFGKEVLTAEIIAVDGKSYLSF